jgi:Uma2 family endonuclease
LLAVTAEHSYVPSMTAAGLVTAEELLHLSIPNKRVELVRGVLVVREPAGGRHGRVAVKVTVELANFVERHTLGAVYAAETGFTIAHAPDTVRAADVAFIRGDRLQTPDPPGFPDLALDLVVEVRSPGDRPGEILTRVGEWLSAGTRLVWVIDPERRIARVYRADGSETIVTADQALDGEDVVPGFSCLLSAVF